MSLSARACAPSVSLKLVAYVAACAAVLAGCGPGAAASHQAAARRPKPPASDSGPGQPAPGWPAVASDAALVAAMNRMPKTLNGWEQGWPSHGTVSYRPPRGLLTLSGMPVANVSDGHLDPAGAVAYFAHGLDQSSSCALPHYPCAQGSYHGVSTMVWSYDQSSIVLIALWPDNAARDQLHDAWLHAQD